MGRLSLRAMPRDDARMRILIPSGSSGSRLVSCPRLRSRGLETYSVYCNGIFGIVWMKYALVFVSVFELFGARLDVNGI